MNSSRPPTCILTGKSGLYQSPDREGQKVPAHRVFPNRPGVLRVGPLPGSMYLLMSSNTPSCHICARAALSAWEAFTHPCKLLAIVQNPPEASSHHQASHSFPPHPTTASTDPGKVPVGYGVSTAVPLSPGRGRLTHLWSPAPHSELRARNPNQRQPSNFPP